MPALSAALPFFRLSLGGYTMLRNIKTLFGHTVKAKDGAVGPAAAFYLDLDRWAVRYIGVGTGRAGRDLVPVSTAAVIHGGIGPGSLEIDLSRNQFNEIPALDASQPLDPGREGRIAGLFGWPPRERVPSAARTPGAEPSHRSAAAVLERPLPAAITDRELFGYHIMASDGLAGTVFDVVADDATWDIRFLAVQTAEKRSLVMPQSITGIDEDKTEIRVNLLRRQVEYGVGYRDRY